MNKTMEYMAYAVPAVSFDLVETQVSGGDTGLYVASGDIGAFADAVEALLDDEDRRVAMSLAARERVAAELDWRAQAARYVGVFDEMFAVDTTPDAAADLTTTTDPQGRRYVDLAAPGALEAFVRSRGPAHRGG